MKKVFKRSMKSVDAVHAEKATQKWNGLSARINLQAATLFAPGVNIQSLSKLELSNRLMKELKIARVNNVRGLLWFIKNQGYKQQNGLLRIKFASELIEVMEVDGFLPLV